MLHSWNEVLQQENKQIFIIQCRVAHQNASLEYIHQTLLFGYIFWNNMLFLKYAHICYQNSIEICVLKTN